LSASIEERLDRIERRLSEVGESVAYLRGVVEQLDKRFSEFREYVENRFEEFEKRLDERFKAIDGRFESIDKRFEEFEKRFSERFEAVDGRFESVDRRFNHLETEIRELRAEIRGWVRWTIGLQVTTLTLIATMMAILLQVALRAG